MNTLSVVHDVLRRQVRKAIFVLMRPRARGRDTALLCRLTGENGRVLAFDVQEDAVQADPRAAGEGAPQRRGVPRQPR